MLPGLLPLVRAYPVFSYNPGQPAHRWHCPQQVEPSQVNQPPIKTIACRHSCKATLICSVLQLRLSLLWLLPCVRFLGCVKLTRTINTRWILNLKKGNGRNEVQDYRGGRESCVPGYNFTQGFLSKNLEKVRPKLYAWGRVSQPEKTSGASA